MVDDASKAPFTQDVRIEQPSPYQGLERSKSQKNKGQAKSGDSTNDKKDKRRSRSWHEKKSSQSLRQQYGEHEHDSGAPLAASAPSSAPGSPPISPVPGSSDIHGDATVAETIPTAIVVKNIPFSLKRDQLLTILNNLEIPRPYAFNYHFDNGVFRGLAFANYRTPEDTDQVVATLNGFEVQGRKLRVEYKRVLPGSQEKTVLTPDFEKDHLDFVITNSRRDDRSPPQKDDRKRDPQSAKDSAKKSNQANGSGSRRENDRFAYINGSPQAEALDLNDPDVLKFYDQLILFKGDSTRDEFIYSKSLTSGQRRSVHMIADKLGLYHYSEGEGDERQVHVVKKPASAAIMRGDVLQKPLSHQKSRSSLRHSVSRDSLRGRDDAPAKRVTINTDSLDKGERSGESPSRSGIRKSAITTSQVSDPNLIYPSRQPRGPEPGNGNNFVTRTPEKRAAVVNSASGLRRQDSRSNLNLHAPVFQPTTA